MKDNELINFVDWLIKSKEAPKGSSFEETVAWINELSSTDDGKKILNQLINTYKGMDIFKDGGKLRHLLCLKSGGKGPDCGCNKKIVKAQPGASLARRIYNRLTGNDTYVDGGGVTRHYAPVSESAHNVLKKAADSPVIQAIPLIGDLADGYLAADYASKGDFKPALASIATGLLLPNMLETGVHMIPGSTRRKAVQTAIDEFEDNARRWVPEDVYDDAGDIVEHIGGQRSNEPWWGWDPIEYRKGGNLKKWR